MGRGALGGGSATPSHAIVTDVQICKIVSSAVEMGFLNTRESRGLSPFQRRAEFCEPLFQLHIYIYIGIRGEAFVATSIYKSLWVGEVSKANWVLFVLSTEFQG